MTEPVPGLGVVGFGRVAERFYAPAIDAASEWTLAAVLDPEPDRVRSVLADMAVGGEQVIVTADRDEFFGTAGVDAVAVTSPNDAHLGGVRAAVDHDLPVICEKPLASTLDDARRIEEISRRERRVVVNLPYRFHRLVERLEAACGVSRPSSITLDFATLGSRLWRPRTDWYGAAERAGGGVSLDLGIHALDVVVRLVGASIAPVGFDGDPSGMEDVATMTLDAAGTAVEVRLDRTARRPAFRVAAEIDGESHVVDLAAGRYAVGDGEAEVVEGGCETAVVERFLAEPDDPVRRLPDAAEALTLQALIVDLWALGGAEHT